MENFLSEWAQKLNVQESQLKQEYDNAYKEIQEQFPNQSDEVLQQKAKMKLKVDYKRKFMSSASPFVGITFASEPPRDPLYNIRETRLQNYRKAVEEYQKSGDTSLFEKYKGVEFRLDEDGNPVPLWPQKKSDGSPNKLAGNDLPEPKDSQMRNVYGICTPLGEKDVKAFQLQLQGRACEEDIKQGQIVNFRALKDDSSTDSLYVLRSNQTEFIPTEDEFLQEGINKFGITGLIEKFLQTFTVSWKDVNDWMEKKKEKPKSEVVPEHYRNGLTVIPESMCVFQNFNPDNKGRIKINICSMEDTLDDKTILCMLDKHMDKTIDFAQNSKVVALGRPWIPEPNENGEVNFILWTSGMYAYPDWKFPRMDVQKMSEKDLMKSNAPPVEEPKKADAEEPKEAQPTETQEKPQPAEEQTSQPEQPVETPSESTIKQPAQETQQDEDPW